MELNEIMLSRCWFSFRRLWWPTISVIGCFRDTVECWKWSLIEFVFYWDFNEKISCEITPASSCAHIVQFLKTPPSHTYHAGISWLGYISNVRNSLVILYSPQNFRPTGRSPGRHKTKKILCMSSTNRWKFDPSSNLREKQLKADIRQLLNMWYDSNFLTYLVCLPYRMLSSKSILLSDSNYSVDKRNHSTPPSTYAAVWVASQNLN